VAGQDLVTDLGAHVLAERLAQERPLSQAAHHVVEALGQPADHVEAPPLDVDHGTLQAAERLGDAAGDEEGESGRHHDGREHQKGHDGQHAEHDAVGLRPAGQRRRRATVGRHAEDEDRDLARQEKDREQPRSHRQLRHTADAGQPALGEEPGQQPTPAVLGDEEDGGDRGQARDDDDADHRSRAAERHERAEQQRPDNPPDDAGKTPANGGDGGHRPRHLRGPPAREVTARAGRGDVRQWSGPADAEHDTGGDQRSETDHEVRELTRQRHVCDLDGGVVHEAEIGEDDHRRQKIHRQDDPRQLAPHRPRIYLRYLRHRHSPLVGSRPHLPGILSGRR